MILSSDELEILEYIKSWKGTSVSIMEICRSAGGRQRFKESPHWAKTLMSRLVEAKLIEVNERGHYCIVVPDEPVEVMAPKPVIQGQAVGDDYFPLKQDQPTVVGEDYFPSTEESESGDTTKWWVSPHIAEILKQAGMNLENPAVE